jgi:hypothetical protein
MQTKGQKENLFFRDSWTLSQNGPEEYIEIVIKTNGN